MLASRLIFRRTYDLFEAAKTSQNVGNPRKSKQEKCALDNSILSSDDQGSRDRLGRTERWRLDLEENVSHGVPGGPPQCRDDPNIQEEKAG